MYIFFHDLKEKMSWLPNSPNVSPFPRQATFATFMIYIALMSANVNFFETCPFFSSILECMMTFLIICYQLIIYPFRLVSQYCLHFSLAHFSKEVISTTCPNSIYRLISCSIKLLLLWLQK